MFIEDLFNLARLYDFRHLRAGILSMKKNDEFGILSCFTMKSFRLLFHLYDLNYLL